MKLDYRIHNAIRRLRIYAEHFQIIVNANSRFVPTGQVKPFVVSMTSFPARIRRSWFAIESILQQSVRPERFVLVLADEEFPDRKLPQSFRRLTRRGLEIFWVSEDSKSYDKLIPIWKTDPGLPVMTVDDDKLISQGLLEQLWKAHENFPDAIIGSRGWVIRNTPDGIHYGQGWARATKSSSPQPNLLLPGGGGVLYPPNCLDERVVDLDAAMDLAPTADDLWFWASALSKETPMICLGVPPLTPTIGQDKTPSLREVNLTANEGQFQAVIEHFQIRSLLEQNIKSGGKFPVAPRKSAPSSAQRSRS